jgi:hypothetical protein
VEEILAEQVQAETGNSCSDALCENASYGGIMEHDVKEVIAKLDDTIYILKEVEELVALSKRRKELRKTIILSLRISDDLYNQEDYIIRKRLDHYPVR